MIHRLFARALDIGQGEKCPKCGLHYGHLDWCPLKWW